MSDTSFQSTQEIYAFVKNVKISAERNGCHVIAQKLDDAFYLGSSGLEVLGAIRKVLNENRSKISGFLTPHDDERLDEVIAFVDKAYGKG